METKVNMPCVFKMIIACLEFFQCLRSIFNLISTQFFFFDVDFESSKAVPVFCMTLSGHCVDSAAVGNIYLS